MGSDGSVGVWHETYLVAAQQYESVYVNMPEFGLGRAGRLEPATGALKTAQERMAANGGPAR